MNKNTLTSILLILLFGSFSLQAQINKLSEQELRKRAGEMGYDVETYLDKQKEKDNKDIDGKKETEEILKVFVAPEPLADSLFRLPAFSKRRLAKDLLAFGYKIFNYAPETFIPSENVPVPLSYIVGPGDEIIITLWGETESVDNLTVSSNGNINIPNVGIVRVSGLSMSALKEKLFNLLSRRYASLMRSSDSEALTFLDVSVGQLRTVKVYVLGEVNRPGGFTLPSLSTAFTALYFAGGPTINGSLRNAEVIRYGKVVSQLDIYDYLLSADKSKDIRLQDEDVIFIPPAGKRTAVSGAVLRPAIYELKKDESLSELLKFSGGLNFNAYSKRISCERIIPFEERGNYKNNILNLDINADSYEDLVNSSFPVESGDIFEILEVDTLYENKLKIAGAVKVPGVYELNTGVRTIKDLILKADGLKTEAFMEHAVIVRIQPSMKKEIFSFNPRFALEGNPAHNLELKNRDSVHVYSVLEFSPERYVEITGAVRKPGKYPRYIGMTLSKLITEAGGLTDSATSKGVEITRLDSSERSTFSTKLSADILDEYWLTPSVLDIPLLDYDRVKVNFDPLKTYNKAVTVRGEVVYPGSYTILHENEKVSEIIKRAGGLKSSAYEKGMYVRRQNYIFDLVKRPNLPDSLIKFQGVFQDSILRKYSDRIPINWDSVVQDTGSSDNVRMEDGDIIEIPKDPEVIYILGEVIIPSTAKYVPGEDLDYYLNQAGGFTQNSDRGNEVVILPNGRKWEHSGFFLIADPEIPSGSTIIVPTIYEVDRSVWPLIRDTFTIISSIAIIVLTVQSLGNK